MTPKQVVIAVYPDARAFFDEDERQWFIFDGDTRICARGLWRSNARAAWQRAAISVYRKRVFDFYPHACAIHKPPDNGWFIYAHKNITNREFSDLLFVSNQGAPEETMLDAWRGADEEVARRKELTPTKKRY